jgi:hypothetical protein
MFSLVSSITQQQQQLHKQSVNQSTTIKKPLLPPSASLLYPVVNKEVEQ